MNRKLILLNLVLLAIVVYAGWQLRVRWMTARAQATAELSKRIKPLPPPPHTPLAQVPPVVPATYAQIAQQDLFDRSRNPTVEVVLPPPPPPKPMPPLPVYHGQMNIGSGPMAILSEKANSQHEALHAGESIGQFKLVDVTTQEIAFEWEGKIIRKNLDELLDRTASAQAAAAPARTEQPSAPPPPPVAKSATGPGADTGRGFKACDPNDNTPVGSVVDGYRKVVNATPFGEACRWDPVGR